MRNIAVDLQTLDELYLALESLLEKQHQDLVAHRFPSFNDEREAESLERRILEAETQLAGLSSSGGLDAQASAAHPGDISARAASVIQHAQHLLELLERNAAQCVQLQSAAQDGLRELQRGGRFLQSVRGYRENQPLFLDSRQ